MYKRQPPGPGAANCEAIRAQSVALAATRSLDVLTTGVPGLPLPLPFDFPNGSFFIAIAEVYPVGYQTGARAEHRARAASGRGSCTRGSLVHGAALAIALLVLRLGFNDLELFLLPDNAIFHPRLGLGTRRVDDIDPLMLRGRKFLRKP